MESGQRGGAWVVTVLASEDTGQEIVIGFDGMHVRSAPQPESLFTAQAKLYRATIETVDLDYTRAANAAIKTDPEGTVMEPGIHSTSCDPGWATGIPLRHVGPILDLDARCGVPI